MNVGNERIETGFVEAFEELAKKAAAEKQLNEQAAASYQPIETGFAQLSEILLVEKSAASKEQSEQPCPPDEARPGVTACQLAPGGTSPPSKPRTTLFGDTDASIKFLQERAATHPLWHPQLSFKRTDPLTGKEANSFETISFARDASGSIDWDAACHVCPVRSTSQMRKNAQKDVVQGWRQCIAVAKFATQQRVLLKPLDRRLAPGRKQLRRLLIRQSTIRLLEIRLN